MTQNTKDWFQYVAAGVMLLSSVVLAYCSFFLLNTVVGSVLAYVSICVAFAGGIFGVSMYIKNQFGEYTSQTDKKLDKTIEELKATVNALKQEKKE